MKYIIFAGGSGTRLWPFSRKKFPKQFNKIFDGKSTFQLMVQRVAQYGMENVYVCTNQNYKELVLEQAPQVLEKNIYLEHEKRDLAPAICLCFLRMKLAGESGPVAILWADHLMSNQQAFNNALQTGEELVVDDPNRFVYIGEKPRFPNHNLGWISIGDEIMTKNGIPVHKFESWVYRPKLEHCEQLFASGKAFWNPGYFITSIDFVLELYKKHMPDMYAALVEAIDDEAKLAQVYPTLESISFDDAIVAKTTPEQAVVLKVDMGWSDPGTLYALKEALAESTEANYTKGNVYTLDSKDCLVYNTNNEQLLTAVGVEGLVIVNIGDAIIVCHKDHVPKVKDMLKNFEGTELKKYL